MAKHSDSMSNSILVIVEATCVSTCVTVNARFQTKLMYMIHHWLQTLRKAHRMNLKVSVGVSASEISVIDIDISISGLVKSE